METPKEKKPILSIPIHTIVNVIRKARKLLREPDETDTTTENK